MLATLPGQFHVISLFGPVARARGTATGLRRVFSSRIGPFTVTSDRSDVLARLAGAELDRETLAVQLLDGAPHPFGDRSPWVPGADVHLTGHGGDHLFVPHPALARDLLRSHPVAALQRIRAYRAMFGWGVRDTLRQLTDRRRYAVWLARTGCPGPRRRTSPPRPRLGPAGARADLGRR